MMIKSKHDKSNSLSSFEWNDVFVSSLGISLSRITNRIVPGLLSDLSNAQVKTLELSTSFFNEDSGSEKKKMLKEMLSLSSVSAFSIHAQFGEEYDFSNLDEDNYLSGISNALESIELCRFFDAEMVVFHSSNEPVLKEERSARIGRVKKALESLSVEAARTGTKIALEFLPRDCIGNNVDELLDIIAEFDPETVGVCLDTNHLMGDYKNLPHIVRQLGKHLFTLHISDYGGVDEQHLLAGQGVIDWKMFIEALKENGYAGPFNYECNFEISGALRRINIVQENFKWICSLLS